MFIAARQAAQARPLIPPIVAFPFVRDGAHGQPRTELAQKGLKAWIRDRATPDPALPGKSRPYVLLGVGAEERTPYPECSRSVRGVDSLSGTAHTAR